MPRRGYQSVTLSDDVCDLIDQDRGKESRAGHLARIIRAWHKRHKK